MVKLDWFFNNRENRSKWLTERFVEEFSKSSSVLDVGCWEKDLKKFLPENIKRYWGIDINGAADQIINLDQIEKLPFEDASFDVVLCADVLEHLENIHLIFDELLRVAKNNVIITLPVPANFDNIKKYLFNKDYKNSPDRSLYGKHSKFYGIPLEKPEDRHRWFFSEDEGREFVEYRANKNNWEIVSFEDNFEYEKKEFNFIRKILSKFNKKLFASTIVFCLSKKENAGK